MTAHHTSPTAHLVRGWSGLGPAVDAFLARFGQATAAQPLLRRIERGGDVAIRDSWLASWIMFGRSYGLPQPDGTIAPCLRARQEPSDDESFGSRNLMYDSATIGGREQIATAWGGAPVDTGLWIAAREADMLFDAIPHYVSAEIVHEVNTAVAEMEDDALFPTDIITPHGFAVLEEPFLISDLHPDTGEIVDGVHNAIRAIGWQVDPNVAGWDADTGQYVARGGVDLFVYTSVGDYLTVYVESLREQLAIEANIPDDRADDRYLMPLDVAPWSFQTSWEPRRTANHEPGTVISSVGEIRRWFLAFMRLCWQEVIVRTPHDELTDRPTRRRWERDRPGTNLDLQVLRLRRRVHPDGLETGTGSPLGYRTKVRPFWRRQYYPSLGPARLDDGSMNPESHRLIWVESFWRGPEDGDIHSPFKVTSVTR